MSITLALIPMSGLLLLSLIKDQLNHKNQLLIKNIALSFSLTALALSIYMWIELDNSLIGYQFLSTVNILNSYQIVTGLDHINIYFILLTNFTTPCAMLSNYYNITHNVKYYFGSLLLLQALQVLVFLVLDIIQFYVFFESVLPVLFILILLYGHGNNRSRSAMLLFLYTLFGSLFMLLSVIYMKNIYGSTSYYSLSNTLIELNEQKLLFLGFFIAFAIKTPLWPFTGWLFRAHADSPLGGSMILASTILKLATYGYIRVLLQFLPDASYYYSPFILTIASITIVYCSLSTIVQQDTKALIAYSSIAHMGVVILGLFSNSIEGIAGAILLSIGHGFVSPGLFVCVGGILYDRLQTRLINYIKGVCQYMPVFCILFLSLTLFNTGIPLSLNFIGEILSLTGSWQRNPAISILGASGIVLSASYSIFLYNRICYSQYSSHLKPVLDIDRREFILLLSFILPTLILGICPNSILNPLMVMTSTLLY